MGVYITTWRTSETLLTGRHITRSYATSRMAYKKGRELVGKYGGYVEIRDLRDNAMYYAIWEQDGEVRMQGVCRPLPEDE